MVYGPFSLSDAVAGNIQYNIWRNTYDANDYVAALVSIDNSDFYGDSFYNSRSWTAYTLDFSNVYTLGNILGQPQVWIAFGFAADGANNAAEGGYVDNIVVSKQVAGVAMPHDLRAGRPSADAQAAPVHLVLPPRPGAAPETSNP